MRQTDKCMKKMYLDWQIGGKERWLKRDGAVKRKR